MILFFSSMVLTMSVVAQLKLNLPPPAIVVICGEDGNGLVVLKSAIDDTRDSLYKQGCFYEDIKVISLDEDYSFVYGTKVLIGENK